MVENLGNSIFRHSFMVGKRFRCIMTIDSSSIGPGMQGQVAAEWQPSMPRNLTKSELRDYRAGRYALLKAIGLNVLVIEG